ncbi:PIG-L family deacetylase [Endozoicomonas sp. Mp262]|uniref:PIG-L family deacetylase n=1 Tax=Endozoicomonas sp. Mp262 TaxID=2919499 RepID=UPI0021D8C66C
MLSGKNKHYLLLSIVLVLCVILGWYGYFLSALLLIVAVYTINELIGSDHIRYNPSKDYEYHFSNARHFETAYKKNKITLPPEVVDNNHTLLLEVDCKASLLGHMFDPYIEMEGTNKRSRQYLERGCGGKRYLNISHIKPSESGTINIHPKFCRLKDENCRIIAFENPHIANKRTLIVAPHADDAEIAAFGVYSSNPESMIVTITAGESEPGSALRKLTESHHESVVLKGKLRSWDSIAIPLWAGLQPNQVINLGYSDNSLEDMHLNPSKTLPADNRAEFRQFNSIRLETDRHDDASWQTLIQDLKEIILNYKPEVIITPHSTMDAHRDHQFSTKAIQEVLKNHSTYKPVLLYYINHLPNTDLWPFGPHGSVIAPPPGTYNIAGIYSSPVSKATQINKACSLEMMHDLRNPIKFKHRVRQWLQNKLINRPVHPLSHEPYLRKSVRENELFIREMIE